MAVGGNEAQPIIQIRLSPFFLGFFLAFLPEHFPLRPSPGKCHPLPKNAGEVVLEVVDGHGKDGLFDHLLDHAALHLHQLLVGNLRDRRELVRRQPMELVPGLLLLDL